MTDLRRTSALIREFCEQRFEESGQIAEVALANITPGADQPPAYEGVAEIAQRLLLADESVLAGAGVVVDPHVQGLRWGMEWWVTPRARTTPQRLELELDARTAGYRDLSELTWYSVPRATGKRHITGPYVDYVCTHHSTLTFTAPLLVAGEFGGVVGVDVLTRTFEIEVQAALGQLDDDVVVVNDAGRIVVASGRPWVSGDLVRELAQPSTPGWRTSRCGRLPLRVARRER